MDWMQQIDELTLTERVLPEQANHYGTLFGPDGLALLGKAAFPGGHAFHAPVGRDGGSAADRVPATGTGAQCSTWQRVSHGSDAVL
jgi:hypothetical protein